MKRFKVLSALFVLFTSIGFISCDSEPVDPVLLDNANNPNNPTNPTNPNLPPPVFTVNIDGQPFVATGTEAVIGDGAILIQGIRGTNGEAVTVTAFGMTTGAYNGENALLAYDVTGDEDFQYTNLHVDTSTGTETYNGAVIISNIDTVNHTVSGTFSFTGHWSNADQDVAPKQLTSGAFSNIPYTTETIDPTDPEYFRAKVGDQQVLFSSSVAAWVNTSLTIQGIIFEPEQKIEILLGTNTSPGTYPIVPSDGITATYKGGGTEYRATEGNVVITSNAEGFVKGTFSFTAVSVSGQVKQITNGEFNIEY